MILGGANHFFRNTNFNWFDSYMEEANITNVGGRHSDRTYKTKLYLYLDHISNLIVFLLVLDNIETTNNSDTMDTINTTDATDAIETVVFVFDPTNTTDQAVTTQTDN